MRQIDDLRQLGLVPNPGYPTAPLSIALMLGKSEAFRTMTTFPLHLDAPIRMVQLE